MIDLFIIADDFTGALDTGVQLAAQGACTRVITDPSADITKTSSDVRVLVLDAETRHLPPKKAYDVVYGAVRQACQMGIPHIYKKTDSALRGNIGAELSAVLDASGAEHLPFLPAFPQIGRTTVGGIHYINDKPVAESVFGIDPFEPVTVSNVIDMIALQSDVSAEVIPVGGAKDTGKKIQVYDAETVADLEAAGQWLLGAGRLQVSAGCAGFGAILPELIGLKPEKKPLPPMDHRLLVLCGSVNPVTQKQLEVAEANGFARIRLTPEQKLTPGYFSTDEGLALLETMRRTLAEYPHVIIDGNDKNGNQVTANWAAAHGLTIDDIRVRISGALGTIMKELFDSPDLGTLLITGGDTLLQCMNCVGVKELTPIGEVFTGTVLSSFSLNGISRKVISKSGGFGEPTLLTDLVTKLQ